MYVKLDVLYLAVSLLQGSQSMLKHFVCWERKNLWNLVCPLEEG